MRVQSLQTPRRGTVLVLFALLAFGLIGLAALIIDVGLARVAQRQMQTAADAAALEGLRWRDELPPGVPSGMTLEEGRRWAAQQTVVALFPDDSGVASGAGQDIPFAPPQGNPLQRTIVNAGFSQARKFYVPRLVTNVDNVPHGDMVAGKYDRNPHFTPEERFDETSDYQRRDFQPDEGNDAFLVRLRRTNNRQGLDVEEGVSTSGSPLPYLFGRATLLSQPSKNDGITVRATAIANAQPVVSVGVAHTLELPEENRTVRLRGVIPMAISAVALSEELSVEVNAITGHVLQAGTAIRIGQVIPRNILTVETDVMRVTQLLAAVDEEATVLRVQPAPGFPGSTPFEIAIGGEILQVTAGAGTNEWTVVRAVRGMAEEHATGAIVTHKSQDSIGLREVVPQLNSSEEYLPVVGVIEGVERVIGFRGFRVTKSPSQFLLSSGGVTYQIAPENASAIPLTPLPRLTENERAQITRARLNLPGGLLAPVLVHRYIGPR